MLKKLKKDVIKELVCGFALLCLCCTVFAQTKDPKLSDLSSQMQTSAKEFFNIMKIVIRVILGLGAVYTIYAFVSESPKRREVLIGVLSAIAISEIMWFILG